MKEQEKQRTRKIRNMVIVFALTAIIISVSTFAWFIGMRTVNVSSFDVEIAATDSLLLSLDGKHWGTTVNINEGNFNDTANTVYENNTNTWGGAKGLIPVSTVGDIDTVTSRIKLYEKASLTASPGGFRLLASEVENKGATEARGYVAFDLFVKNFSGRQYIKDLNILDEEAIYMTTDSKVKVASSGVSDTGLENSVRVAFGQIGRVEGTTNDPDKITSIECNDNAGVPSIAGDVTGICRTAHIWEPNDISHNRNAISWYEKTCLARTGANVTAAGSFAGACGTIADGTAYPTYAINSPIASSDNVDVYDGAVYNGYTASTKLAAYPYFTDTMKDKTGIQRPEIFTLSPNSITKVRVYVFIEGQDIDNYDFAQIGKRIAVNFGFTKERFNENDIDYELGPDYSEDKFAPVITLDPAPAGNTITMNVGEQLVLPKATATDKVSDSVNEDLTRKIVVNNKVNTAVAGTYYVTYNVSDWAGNYAQQVTVKVIVQ